MNPIQPLGIIFVLMLFVAPAVAIDAGSLEIATVVNELLIHPDNNVAKIGYTVNGEKNLQQYIIPGNEVIIRLNNLPEGGVFKAALEVGGKTYSYTGNPITLEGFPWTEAISIPVELTVTLPPNNQPQGTSGSSTWLPNTDTPTDATPQGIYTASVEDGGAAQFPASGIIFQVIMPEGYLGDVVLTTYKLPLSLEGTNVYHQCDITIDGELADGETATVKFKIPLSVLQARGLTAADACLYHSADGGKTWDKCPTVYEVRGDIVYYEATVDGFSPFMVVFEKGAATPAGSAGDVTPTDVPSPGFGAALVLGALGVVWALRRR